MTTTHHVQPTPAQTVFNRAVGWLADHGLGLAGARTLTVVGRSTGEPRSTPVNPFTVAGHTYLLSPRGNTQWSRNLRAAGECDLRRGHSTTAYVATEMADADKPALLRPYLKRWGWEVSAWLPQKVSHTSTDEELLAIAPHIPAFLLTPAPRTLEP
ncbi:nitroreductase family deazaflavin-dependent oxidoreductase [Williamsia sp. SKLECPSW1]